MKLNEKLLPLLSKHKPLKVAVGGRGSGKSIGFGDIFTMKMETERADVYCLREYQDSISDSVHRVFKDSIQKRMKLSGWKILENKIIAPSGAQTAYKGASRNPDSIQSAQGYKYSWFEEGHRASQDSLDKLIPTIIRNPGAECWFSANPQSSNDPFSQRFVTPYLNALLKDGFYEDDVHLIVFMNWRDNPWWNEEQESIRKWDYENLPRAKYDWIWEGAFNDSVENSIILSEWFDACIDAHKKLGFKPEGAIIAAHDPSDTGGDSKGFAVRHGSVVLDVQEKITGDINEGGDWATGLALQHNADSYTWDCDGLGIGLGRDVSKAFEGKHAIISMFKGSESPDFPEAIYKPALDLVLIGQKTNKEVFRNKRAQYYFALRDRIYKTYRAVEYGEYHNPDEMISFSSDITALTQLRSELCRMPIKPNANGLCELYTKQDMKTKFKFKSPNLSDSVMMLMRHVHKVNSVPKMPQPLKVMGRR